MTQSDGIGVLIVSELKVVEALLSHFDSVKCFAMWSRDLFTAVKQGEATIVLTSITAGRRLSTTWDITYSLSVAWS